MAVDGLLARMQDRTDAAAHPAPAEVQGRMPEAMTERDLGIEIRTTRLPQPS